MQEKISREDKKILNRKAILESAFIMFCKNGFVQTRIEDVAKHANLGKGTIYLHFESKENLYQSMIEYVLSPVLKQIMNKPYEKNVSARERLEDIYNNVVKLLQISRIHNIFCLLISEGLRDPKLVDTYYEHFVKPMITYQKILLNEAANNNELNNKNMAKYPQLIMAPLLIACMWKRLFGDKEQLNMEDILKNNLQLVFK